jgi:hypothetical protein
MAHALNLVSEKVRSQFPQVDQLVAETKMVFRKAPSRVAAYKEQHPTLPLVPSPVLTRWTTWLRATIFYCDHFEEVKSVIKKIQNLLVKSKF